MMSGLPVGHEVSVLVDPILVDQDPKPLTYIYLERNGISRVFENFPRASAEQSLYIVLRDEF